MVQKHDSARRTGNAHHPEPRPSYETNIDDVKMRGEPIVFTMYMNHFKNSESSKVVNFGAIYLAVETAAVYILMLPLIMV